jgi:hypothetical protein
LLKGGAALLGLSLAGRSMHGAAASTGQRTPVGASVPGSNGLPAAVQAFPYRWSATSPATHLGDTYTLILRNPGPEPVAGLVRTVIMDHARHHNELAVQGAFNLGPGETKEFSAANGYGTANHFSTHLATDAGKAAMLSLTVTLRDAEGTETCRFNERAFMIRSREEVRQQRQQTAEHSNEAEDHQHAEGKNDPAAGSGAESLAPA